MGSVNKKKIASTDGYWQVSHAAGVLTSQACTISARHIQDGMLRIKFNREVAYYARGIVRDVGDGRKTAEEGLKALEAEQSVLTKSATALQQGIGLAAGVLQVTGGVAMCGVTSGLGCGIGLLTATHGLNNIYENGTNLLEARTDSQGYVRKFYQGVSEMSGGTEFEGNMAYGVFDLAFSGYGAFRKVLKPGSWRLFKYVETDYIRAYKGLNNRAFMFDRASDAVTGAGMRREWKEKNE
ncbi:hypothetical protein AFK24_20780 [Pseudomonas syringae]|uniref:DUF4225 domain-containing protein n=1 Tax=Pseudomonas syringae TaxID=317 RepID=A0A1C7Z2A7_PSESX|nr:DUF4225 domain-containing protein [Pseudomonas syringae]OCR23137.1 hypothetical protein AFK24_20780 [Pseudomonas syringae]